MVKHSQLFLDSLIHPKKLAAYRILSIGKIIQYVFILITIITVFSFVSFFSGVSDDQYHLTGVTFFIKEIQWLLYPFAFLLQYLINTISLMLQISVYAFIGTALLKLFHRRGEYRHMWRTSALAITWSSLLTIIFSYSHLFPFIEWSIGVIVTLVFLTIASLKYPKISNHK